MILCVMRIPPSPVGHGGSQRAWALLKSLAEIGPVDFVLVSRKSDKDVASVSLTAAESLARTVTAIDIPSWEITPTFTSAIFRKLHTGWIDLARMRSHEAPKIPDEGLRNIAAQLPVRSADVIFAGRLPCAIIVNALIEQGLLEAGRKIVDFDDIMSRFRLRQLAAPNGLVGVQTRILAHIDARLVRHAEAQVANTWDSISVCTDDDVTELRQAYPRTLVVKVPNVIDRPLLAPTMGYDARLLFVGNLSFAPNVQGLKVFLREAWPIVRRSIPTATLRVVGMLPSQDVLKACQTDGVSLHPDVASLEPYYQDCDVVICPILFGGGTRIKVLEAMAYGRPVVATSLGAEGLDIVPDQEAILADTMTAFAEGVIGLAKDPGARLTIASKARALQQSRFGLPAMAAAVKGMTARQGRNG